MKTIYLVDNSTLQRVDSSDVHAAMVQLNDHGIVATCLPVLLETGYSARNTADHQQLMRRMRSSMLTLPPVPDVLEIALSIQAALFRAGKGRAAGVSDLQIAATAIHHSAEGRPVVLVHYDRDFDHIASVEPRLHSRWIVPPGSVEGHARAPANGMNADALPRVRSPITRSRCGCRRRTAAARRWGSPPAGSRTPRMRG